MDELKCPEIENLQKITPESFEQYVRFVRNMRHNQNRYFRLRTREALELSKRMETELDELNNRLLCQQQTLF